MEQPVGFIPPQASSATPVRRDRRSEARFAETRADPASIAYLDACGTRRWARHPCAARRIRVGGDAAVFDDPAKTLDTTARTDVLLFPQLVMLIGKPRKSLDLISPYFVPRDDGTAALVALAGSGVQVRILTNSLAASDVSACMPDTRKHRAALLKRASSFTS